MHPCLINLVRRIGKRIHRGENFQTRHDEVDIIVSIKGQSSTTGKAVTGIYNHRTTTMSECHSSGGALVELGGEIVSALSCERYSASGS